MKKRLKLILTLSLVLLAQIGFAQTKTVTGTVTDGSLPLPGVSIVIKGTQTGTQTDFDGGYSITASAGDVLVFSYVSMRTQEITAGQSNTIDVTMVLDTTLDEVVVVAYGTQSKERLTGSVTQIKTEEIEGRALSNSISALDGAAPGVRLLGANGQPGSTPAIRIRGFGSINASQAPLIIVDGAEFTGNISSINPNDIASFSVLKDAASTALYGNRAGNGVVLITTKRGKQGKPKISLSVSQGISDRSIEEYRRVTAEEYYPLIWESLRNQFVTQGTPIIQANQQASDQVFGALGVNPFNVPNNQIVGTDGLLNPNAELVFESLDFQEPLLRTGYVQNVNFNYSGANETTDYFVSLAYFKEEGFIRSSDFERINARVNLNSKLSQSIKTGLNISGTSDLSDNGNRGASNSIVNPFFATRFIAPIYPVFLNDPVNGGLLLDDNGNPQFDPAATNAGSSNGRNAVQENLLNLNRNRGTSLSARTYLEVNFLKNFKATVSASLDRRHFANLSFQNEIVGDGAPAGRVQRLEQTTDSRNFNQIIEYSKDLDKHSIDVLIGHESFQRDFRRIDADRQGIIATGNTELTNFTTVDDATSQSSILSREGYFSRLNYGYDNKYFFDASYRRDASSRFLNNRFGDFWSFGASWRIIQEKFMENTNWIDDLKLRTTYGQIGNDNVNGGDDFPAQNTFTAGLNNGQDGGVRQDLAAGNPDLTWETTNLFNVAIDFSVLNNRISGSLEYFDRVTEDLIFAVPAPREAGVNTNFSNLGSLFNRGFEFDLNFKIIENQNFSWNLNVNGGTLENEVTEVEPTVADGFDRANSQRIEVGRSLFDYFIRDFVGVDPADGSSLYVLDPELANGGADERVFNGQDVTTSQAKALETFNGSAIYDITGAFTHTFRYKQFSLGMTFLYQLGGETFDATYRQLLSSGNPGTTFSPDIFNRWQQPGDITNVPRLDAGSRTDLEAVSNRFLISSDYLALRNINFTYTFPDSLVSNLGFSGGRAFVNAENVFLANGRRGLNTLQTFNGAVSNVFTPSRTITFGLDLNF